MVSTNSSGTNWRRPAHAQRTDPSACPICACQAKVGAGKWAVRDAWNASMQATLGKA